MGVAVEARDKALILPRLGNFETSPQNSVGVEGDATTNSTKAMGDGGAGRDDKPNAAISAAGLKIPEQNKKFLPKTL